jgi:hypothetical protein
VRTSTAVHVPEHLALGTEEVLGDPCRRLRYSQVQEQARKILESISAMATMTYSVVEAEQ